MCGTVIAGTCVVVGSYMLTPVILEGLLGAMGPVTSGGRASGFRGGFNGINIEFSWAPVCIVISLWGMHGPMGVPDTGVGVVMGYFSFARSLFLELGSLSL